MKHRIKPILILLLFVQVCMASDKKGREAKLGLAVDTIHLQSTIQFVPNVTIQTPYSVIYDDATDNIEYKGYKVFSMDNRLVLKVESSLHKPVRLKLDAGNYIVKLDDKTPKVYAIEVKDDQFNTFIIKQ